MSKNAKIIWGVVVILVIILVVWKVSDKPSVSQGPIKVGLLLPLTGPVAGLGEAMKAGYEWKAKQLNTEGKNIELVIADSQSNPKDALTAFTKLVDIDGVKVVFTTMSAVGMTIKPVAEQKGVLFWVDAAHPDITKDSQFTLRHSNTSNGDANVLGNKAIELGSKKVGIVFQNDDWGQAASRILGDKLALAQIEALPEPIDNKASDFRQQLTKLSSSKVDTMIFIVAGPPAGILIKQARELGFKGDIISSVGIILTPDSQKIAGEYLKGTYYQDYEASPAFLVEYKAEFGTEPAMFSRIAYTDLELLSAALEATSTTSPAVISQYIKGLGTFTGRYETVSIDPSGDIVVKTVVNKW